MTPHTLRYTTEARNCIQALPPKDQRIVLDAVRMIQQDPRRRGTSLVAEFAGYHRAKKGRYRVFYRVEDSAQTIDILFLGYRKKGDKRDAYKLFGKLVGKDPPPPAIG